MKDPYEEVWNEIGNALQKHSEMIVWIAERVLSVKDFKEFTDVFRKKKDNHDDLIGDVMRESQ